MSNSYDISKRQLNELYDSTKAIVQRSRARKEAKLPEQAREINSFLYNPDELSIFGKEYWFFLFTGMESSFKDQLMASFGRNNNNSMKINNIPQLKDTDDYFGGIGETWFYLKDGTTQFGKLGGKIIPRENSIAFETDEYTIQLSGQYPEYRLEIYGQDEPSIKIETKMPEHGDSLEFFSIERANLGVEIGNVYLDYQGMIQDNEFKREVLYAESNHVSSIYSMVLGSICVF